MAENHTDDNTATASSAVANVDDKPNASTSSSASTSASGETSEKSLQDVVSEAVVASQAATKGDVKPEESGSKIEPDEAAEAAEKTDGEEAAASEDKSDADGEGGEELPPFHEHPRWKEVVAEKNDLKAKVEQFEPLANNYRAIEKFCQERQITADQFNATLEIAALLNSDPAAAYEKLKPVVDGLAQLKGDAIPADLAQEVEDGLLSEERAKEIARLRGQDKLSTSRHQQEAQQRQQQQLVNIQQGIADWETGVKKANPDFRPKANENEPDGVYELVCDKFRASFVQAPPQTQQQAVQMLQKAYDAVQKSIGRFMPKPALRKALSSNGASKTTQKEPESPEEAVAMALARSSG